MSIYKLTRMQAQVQEAIRREARAIGASPWRLLRLKKLRLLIKDRLTARALSPQVS